MAYSIERTIINPVFVGISLGPGSMPENHNFPASLLCCRIVRNTIETDFKEHDKEFRQFIKVYKLETTNKPSFFFCWLLLAYLLLDRAINARDPIH